MSEKSSYIGMPMYALLDVECKFIEMAYGETCYLVGSSLERSDFRDVDIRMIMGDAKFQTLFGKVNGHGSLSALWNLSCISISGYLSNKTGLNIDFQIQQMTLANKMYGENIREPLGMFPLSNEDLPKWYHLQYRDKTDD